MAETLEILERSEVHGHVPAPTLVILADPDATLEASAPLLGRSATDRLLAMAARAGFARAIFAPGTTTPSEILEAGAEGSAGPRTAVPIEELATGEPIEHPALVVFEGAVVHPDLLSLMVDHPLDSDERFTLYDDVGRPAACFFGKLWVVPGMLPLTEELPWPDGFSSADIVRQVYEEDRARARSLVLRGAGLELGSAPGWQRRVQLPTLRWLADSGRPLAQLNLVGVGLVTLALPLVLLGSFPWLLLAALASLLGVHVTTLIPIVRQLRAEGGRVEAVDEYLSAAARPLAQAALMGGLTYAIVAETDRSPVAAVVLLVAGAAAVVLGLLQARLLLRGRPADIFALPDAEAAAARLGVGWWPALRRMPLLEVVVVFSSLPGIPELPWSALAAGAAARLWRWFAGPPISLREAVIDVSDDR